MKFQWGCFAACFVAIAGWTDAGETPGSSADAVDFSRQVLPILAEKCISCHSGAEPKGGIRLNDHDSALGEADSGATPVVPHKPDESELLRRITAEDSAERMPPEGERPLTPEEIETLRRWIAEGAVWAEHWAFRPLQNTAPPAVRNEAWIRNDIDRYVLAGLEAESIAPSPEADRYTLIKRLHYDILGLPAPIEEVDAFVADESRSAYETLVERLLASPHFGERWGRHWLDLAHYADSDGFEKDRARPDAYVYRDWVIDAVSRDVPYDQFTIEQLAGDLLPAATTAQRVATGFLRQTLTNEEGGVDQEEYRVAACVDRTDTVSTVWLGLTMGCARCHTHKYDALPHADYYRFFAFFNNAEEVQSPLPVEADNREALEAELRPLQAALDARLQDMAPQAAAWEVAERARVMAQREGSLSEIAVSIVSVTSEAVPETRFEIEGDRVFVECPAGKTALEGTEGAARDAEVVVPTVPERDTYTVTVGVPFGSLTGLRLWAQADDRLPGKGPGRSADGAFVLTRFDVSVVRPDGSSQPVAMHRASADYSQEGFSPESTIADPALPETGWAVGGKLSEEHRIQLRTREPLELAEGATLRISLAQRHGSQHLLGRFRLAALSGNERGLHLPKDSIADALEMYPEKRVARVKLELFDYFVNEVAHDEESRELRELISAAHVRHHARLMDVRTIARPRQSRITHVFDRGDFLSPTQEVSAGTPSVLGEFRPVQAMADRLDLARWLVSAENPLTPRVAVNHVWQHLFGAGLVRTPSDFGVRGEPPTHPELLDALAARFQGPLGWSRKELIRLIVGSATYRQASSSRHEWEERDPRNAKVFRQNRIRVESEVVRDLNLAVAGLLSAKVGGPSVFPPMPDDLAKLSYANNFSWTNSEGEDRQRRGMYTFFKRTIPHPNLMTFDSPDANVSCVARTVSNTPLQALTLLNNEVHVEAARALVARVLARDLTDDEQRLGFLMRLCVARPPTDSEIATLARVLRESRDYYAAHPDDAIVAAGGKAEDKDLDLQVSKAAWAAVARIVLNLDEFLTRE